MASTRRKSVAIALGVVGVAGLSLASAAQLSLGTASLGAGSEVVSSCQPAAAGPITVGFTPAHAAGGYAAGDVTLGNIADNCDGLSYAITLTGEDGAVLGDELTGTIDGDSLERAVPGVAASAVTGIAVVIYSVAS